MMGRRDRALALALAATSAATSVLLNAGVVCSNDGAHYALVRALADDHSVAIDGQMSYTRNIDYSERGGHLYSDRPPGTAFAAVPFYLLARALGASDAGRQFAAGLLAALAGALATVLTFRIGRQLGLSAAGATAAALALALCTPLRTYSTGLWNHALAACLLALAAWLALAQSLPWARRLGLGLAAGYLSGVDYAAALPAALLLGVVAWPLRRDLRALAPLALGCVAGLAPMLAYHTVAFGSPFATPYQFHNLTYRGGIFASTRSLGAMYGGSFLEGFFGLLFSWRAGLLLYSPILVAGLLALPGFVPALGRRRALIAVAPWVLTLLVAAKHVTWHGGAPHDARYLVGVLPLLCLPVGFALDRVRGHLGALAGFGALFFLSAAIQVVKHAALWMRSIQPWILELSRTLPGDPAPTARAFLAWLFPHPIAAACVLAVGLGAAVALARYGAAELEAGGGRSGATAIGSPTTR